MFETTNQFTIVFPQFLPEFSPHFSVKKRQGAEAPGSLGASLQP